MYTLQGPKLPANKIFQLFIYLAFLQRNHMAYSFTISLSAAHRSHKTGNLKEVVGKSYHV